MTITSFSFFLILLLGAIIYYAFPNRFQWITLLVMSLIFYCLATNPITILYLVFSTSVAYFSTICMQMKRENGDETKGVFILAIVAVVLNAMIWLFVKGFELWKPILLILPRIGFGLHNEELLMCFQPISALGMGYYTLQVIGYIIDCYWGSVKPQKNILKLYLFVSYFPQLTNGPISRYSQFEQIYSKHSLSYENITFGIQRIMWGMAKKLVISERIGVIVTGISNDFANYHGFFSWILILLYPLQMYSDFSGCIDIVLGASEIFGIKLPENFNNPFFSRTSQEFWQRWHITLGAWAKDYVLYPLLKSKFMIKLSKNVSSKFGKKTGKFVINLVGMFFLWMMMGIWHGGWRYIVGVSLWYWSVLMIGNLLAPIGLMLTEKTHMKTESFGWHLFQSIRTYIVYAIGASFFCLGVSEAIYRLKDCIKVILKKGYANPWILFDGSITNLGITYGDVNVVIIGCAMLFFVGFLRERYEYARRWISKQSVGFRWFIWMFLFVYILVFGKYGPGYDASEFIYQGF